MEFVRRGGTECFLAINVSATQNNPSRRSPPYVGVAAGNPRSRTVVLLLGMLWLAACLTPVTVQADEELDFGVETHRLAAIEISGNETFTSYELKDLLKIREASWTRPLHVPRYQPQLVATQVRVLRTFYRNRGFHQVQTGLDSSTTVPDKGDVL